MLLSTYKHMHDSDSVVAVIGNHLHRVHIMVELEAAFAEKLQGWL